MREATYYRHEAIKRTTKKYYIQFANKFEKLNKMGNFKNAWEHVHSMEYRAPIDNHRSVRTDKHSFPEHKLESDQAPENHVQHETPCLRSHTRAWTRPGTHTHCCQLRLLWLWYFLWILLSNLNILKEKYSCVTFYVFLKGEVMFERCRYGERVQFFSFQLEARKEGNAALDLRGRPGTPSPVGGLTRRQHQTEPLGGCDGSRQDHTIVTSDHKVTNTVQPPCLTGLTAASLATEALAPCY